MASGGRGERTASARGEITPQRRRSQRSGARRAGQGGDGGERLPRGRRRRGSQQRHPQRLRGGAGGASEGESTSKQSASVRFAAAVNAQEEARSHRHLLSSVSGVDSEDKDETDYETDGGDDNGRASEWDYSYLDRVLAGSRQQATSEPFPKQASKASAESTAISRGVDAPKDAKGYDLARREYDDERHYRDDNNRKHHVHNHGYDKSISRDRGSRQKADGAHRHRRGVNGANGPPQNRPGSSRKEYRQVQRQSLARPTQNVPQRELSGDIRRTSSLPSFRKQRLHGRRNADDDLDEAKGTKGRRDISPEVFEQKRRLDHRDRGYHVDEDERDDLRSARVSHYSGALSSLTMTKKSSQQRRQPPRRNRGRDPSPDTRKENRRMADRHRNCRFDDLEEEEKVEQGKEVEEANFWRSPRVSHYSARGWLNTSSKAGAVTEVRRSSATGDGYALRCFPLCTKRLDNDDKVESGAASGRQQNLQRQRQSSRHWCSCVTEGWWWCIAISALTGAVFVVVVILALDGVFAPAPMPATNPAPAPAPPAPPPPSPSPTALWNLEQASAGPLQPWSWDSDDGAAVEDNNRKSPTDSWQNAGVHKQRSHLRTNAAPSRSLLVWGAN